MIPSTRTKHHPTPLSQDARNSCSKVLAFLVLIGSAISQPASACSVPVFRYALERWLPDAYHIKVLNAQSLTDSQISWLAPLHDASSTQDSAVNLVLERIDFKDQTNESSLSFGKQKGNQSAPTMIVSYPIGHFDQKPFWTAELNEQNIQRITDSPARREIARRLLKGESAVWVLLESGQVAKDQLAYNRLTERLEHLSEHLELPALDPVDVADGLISIEEEELSIAFSTLKISRDDPDESFFIQMLLGTESDLTTFNEPMAFPIFGRGRALYALIGEGIAPDVIDEACVFLTGACSCEVKEQNPGVDLLMSVDWDHLVTRQFEIDRELPPLTGFVTLEAPATNSFHPESPQVHVSEVPYPEAETSLDPSQDSPSVLLTTAIACAIIGFAVLLSGFYFLRRNQS
jgi:hypothetical protein